MEALNRLVKALSILEKYGCNLTSPSRPRYWRSVKHNNPVFRTTVDAIKVSKEPAGRILGRTGSYRNVKAPQEPAGARCV